MTKYDIVKLPGASPEVIKEALNKRAEDGFILEFVDSGWFVLAKWEDTEEDERQVIETDKISHI